MINWKADRYEVLGSYPGSTYQIKDVVERAPGISQDEFDKHPNIFRKLKWWECRQHDFNSLFTIKFCRIVKTHGYWRDGDVLPVGGYEVNAARKNPIFIGFLLKGYNIKPELYELDRVVPATEEEFLKWKAENKVSITP